MYVCVSECIDRLTHTFIDTWIHRYIERYGQRETETDTEIEEAKTNKDRDNEMHYIYCARELLESFTEQAILATLQEHNCNMTVLTILHKMITIHLKY